LVLSRRSGQRTSCAATWTQRKGRVRRAEPRTKELIEGFDRCWAAFHNARPVTGRSLYFHLRLLDSLPLGIAPWRADRLFALLETDGYPARGIVQRHMPDGVPGCTLVRHAERGQRDHQGVAPSVQ
jgi:hypothetical protein